MKELCYILSVSHIEIDKFYNEYDLYIFNMEYDVNKRERISKRGIIDFYFAIVSNKGYTVTRIHRSGTEITSLNSHII